VEVNRVLARGQHAAFGEASEFLLAVFKRFTIICLLNTIYFVYFFEIKRGLAKIELRKRESLVAPLRISALKRTLKLSDGGNLCKTDLLFIVYKDSFFFLIIIALAQLRD